MTDDRDAADRAYDEVLNECAQMFDEGEIRAARIATYKMRDRWKSQMED